MGTLNTRSGRSAIQPPIVAAALLLIVAACHDDAPTKPTRRPDPRQPTILIVSGDGQRAEVGTTLPLPLVVRVLDTLGVPARNVVVRFSSTGVPDDSGTTGTNGQVSIQWTLGGRSAIQSIAAVAFVYTKSPYGVATTTFTARGTAGPPARVAMGGGAGGIAAPNSTLDTVVAFATDRFGNASPEAAVAWLVKTGGGSVRALSERTDTLGAAAALWTLGPAEGLHTISVTVGAVSGDASATASDVFPGVSVVVGDSHTCALTEFGAAYCWGANSSAQLGIGRTDDKPHRFPERVATGLRFTTLVAGAEHTCGLTREGKAHCWGNGRSGQLGSGFIGLSFTAFPVVGDITFIALTAGGMHTCGLTSAHTAYCWGDNSVGQLGDGTLRVPGISGQNSSIPTPVLATGAGDFLSIVAGTATTCGIALAGTYCWGTNAQRELGGEFPGRCYVVWSQFVYDGTPLPCSSEPARLPTLTEIISLSASGSGWCAVTGALELACWGNGFLRPQIVSARAKRVWVVGADACSLDIDDIVRCRHVWGGAGFPIVRPFGDQVDLDNIASRTGHWCGLSRDARPLLYCWGRNTSGQIGDGTDETRPLPVVVRSQRRT